MTSTLTFFCLGLILLPGCYASGEKFHTAQTSPSKATVYIYRAAIFRAVNSVWCVNINGKPVTTMLAGGYYPYITEPGALKFEAKREIRNPIAILDQSISACDEGCLDLMSLDVKAGQTYFLRLSTVTATKIYTLPTPKLELVPREQAEEEIKNLCLLPPH